MTETKKGPPATACPHNQHSHCNSSTPNKATYKEVKDGLFGKIAEVLAYVGCDDTYADGKHHLCSCGAIKLRISDQVSGAGGCDSCGAKWTNPVDLAAHLSGIDSQSIRDRLAEHFGIAGHREEKGFTFHAANLDSKQIDRLNGSPSKKNNPSLPVACDPHEYSTYSQVLSLEGWNPSFMHMVISRKTGTSESAWRDLDTVCGTWAQSAKCKSKPAVAIPVRV